MENIFEINRNNIFGENTKIIFPFDESLIDFLMRLKGDSTWYYGCGIYPEWIYDKIFYIKSITLTHRTYTKDYESINNTYIIKIYNGNIIYDRNDLSIFYKIIDTLSSVLDKYPIYNEKGKKFNLILEKFFEFNYIYNINKIGKIKHYINDSFNIIYNNILNGEKIKYNVEWIILDTDKNNSSIIKICKVIGTIDNNGYKYSFNNRLLNVPIIKFKLNLIGLVEPFIDISIGNGNKNFELGDTGYINYFLTEKFDYSNVGSCGYKEIIYKNHSMNETHQLDDENLDDIYTIFKMINENMI